MRLELRRIRVGPVRQVHHDPHAGGVRRQFGGSGFHDYQPVAVEQIGVIAEHSIKLRDKWMVLRNNFGLYLRGGSFELCSVAFHHMLLSLRKTAPDRAATPPPRWPKGTRDRILLRACHLAVVDAWVPQSNHPCSRAQGGSAEAVIRLLRKAGGLRFASPTLQLHPPRNPPHIA